MLVCGELQLRSLDGIRIRVVANGSAIVRIEFCRNAPGDGAARGLPDDPLIRLALSQLEQYFAGRLRHFDLPLHAQGTDFQQRVWAALAQIPYGETRSYRQIAQLIGSPAAVRAVGAANGRNPIPIVVPCHRVIGSDGTLVGFGGGLPVKRLLLELERGGQGYPARAPLAGRDHTAQQKLSFTGSAT
jgi:methylated-DNA-[protein]-cysteine S-methyltransferase